MAIILINGGVPLLATTSNQRRENSATWLVWGGPNPRTNTEDEISMKTAATLKKNGFSLQTASPRLTNSVVTVQVTLLGKSSKLTWRPTIYSDIEAHEKWVGRNPHFKFNR